MNLAGLRRSGLTPAVWLLPLLMAAGCGSGQPFNPERSLRLALEASGLPDAASAEYRIFLQDSIGIAHGDVTHGETDTVRISSSDRLKVQWQDAPATISDANYVFAPSQRESLIEAGDEDTTVSAIGEYALASGGFVLTTPGIPAEATGFWRAVGEDSSVLAVGALKAGVPVRRGDLPPGTLRLQLDTAVIELDGVRHGYAPAKQEIPLNITATVDLIPIDAPYALSTAVLQLNPSGLPPGAGAPWGLNIDNGTSYGGFAAADSATTLDLVAPGNYTLEWGEITVDGVTYLPDPAIQQVTLTPQIEAFEFGVTYTASLINR
ncbi:MAG TPA: hypothetical protein VH763_17035 [Gemmatimonadales bacterium]|jgi:hypothetical protein